LHPQPDPDDGSYYARGNAIAVLSDSGGLLGDLRQSVLLADRINGEVRTRMVEAALGKLSPREDEAVMSLEQARSFFAGHAGSPALRLQIEEARRLTHALTAELNKQIDAADAPDLTPLVSMLDAILSTLPGTAPVSEAAEAPAPAPAAAATARPAAQPVHAAPGAISSRADVIRVIDMACEYLERAEPSNPAQLLLRRAKQLLDQNFLQLIHVLAPGSLDEVARLMGVDAESLRSPSSGA
jgi:type VI secretion system protein ImpA